MRLLLKAGASANIGGGWGRAGTHLHHAVLQRLDLELIEILLAHGAHLAARDRDGGTALAALLAAGLDHRIADDAGDTPSSNGLPMLSSTATSMRCQRFSRTRQDRPDVITFSIEIDG